MAHWSLTLKEPRMSKILPLMSEIYGICEKAGLDPKSVAAIHITPGSAAFDLLVADTDYPGCAEARIVVTYPWDLV